MIQTRTPRADHQARGVFVVAQQQKRRPRRRDDAKEAAKKKENLVLLPSRLSSRLRVFAVAVQIVNYRPLAACCGVAVGCVVGCFSVAKNSTRFRTSRLLSGLAMSCGIGLKPFVRVSTCSLSMCTTAPSAASMMTIAPVSGFTPATHFEPALA